MLLLPTAASVPAHRPAHGPWHVHLPGSAHIVRADVGAHIILLVRCPDALPSGHRLHLLVPSDADLRSLAACCRCMEQLVCSILGMAMRHRHLSLLARMLIHAAGMQPMLHARPVMLSLAQRGKQSCE